jgi:hypothetical protein
MCCTATSRNSSKRYGDSPVGKIKNILSKKNLPDRELHNSRMFVDLSENVHIHFRELRLMFGVDEFFEFFSILKEGARDIKRYLRKNPDYEEQKVFDGILIGGGPDRQMAPLKSSPQPHESKYFPHRLQIELQEESVIDTIHIHYRDYRVVMNIQTFREFVEGMNQALQNLEKILEENPYDETKHLSRKIVSDKRWAEGKIPPEGKTKKILQKIKHRTTTAQEKGKKQNR